MKNIVAGLTKCPICGSQVVLRKGKYGKFYGCSRYPKCRWNSAYEGGNEKSKEMEEIEEKISNKYIEMQKVLDEREKINEKKIGIEIDINELLEKQKQAIQNNCPHFYKHAETLDKDYGNGYDVVRWGKEQVIVCDDCGKVLSRKDVT